METGENYIFNLCEFAKLQLYLPIIRQDITRSIIPDKHITKLIEKYDRLKSELKLSIDNFDLIWSFIGSAEISFRTYYQNKIPDSLKEIIKIIWEVQCRCEHKSLQAAPPIKID